MNNKITVNLRSICLYLMVALSFLHHIFIYSNLYSVYIVLLFSLAIVAALSGKLLILQTKSTNLMWALPTAAMLFSYYFISSRNGSARGDILVLLAGIMFCMLTIHKMHDYSNCLKLLVFMGSLHGIGVILHRFLPSVHRVLISVLPDQMVQLILQSNTRGFTVNSGFSAAFVTVGILALLALRAKGHKAGFRYKALLVFLFIALLFTGKRAHPLFLLIAVVLCFLLPLRGSKRIRRYWIIFLVFAVLIVVFLLFKDILVSIPFFSEIIRTLNGVMLGEDITTARTALSKFAWQLFLQNPIFGIGWGDFRTSVVGNVTHITELDTHNIYLQLLSETGVIGFIAFMLPMFITWNKAKNAFRKVMQSEDAILLKWKSINYFSFAFQTFFLLYGLTGNPLFDPNWQILYMVSCGMTISYCYYERKASVSLKQIHSTQETKPHGEKTAPMGVEKTQG